MPYFKIQKPKSKIQKEFKTLNPKFKIQNIGDLGFGV